MAATIRITRTESSSVASTVSITAAVGRLRLADFSDDRYWFRPTLAAINNRAIDTARPDAAWTRPRLRSRATTTAPANSRIETIGSTSGQVVEEPDPPLQLGQLVRLEEHERGAGVVRELVEHRQPVGRQLLLGRVLDLGQVHGDLAVGGLEGADLVAEQQVVDLLVRVAQRLLPEGLESGALHQLQGDLVGGGLDGTRDRIGQEAGLLGQGVLHPLLDVGPGHQALADLGGDRRLDRLVLGQRSHRGHERVGVEQLVAGVDHDHRQDGEEAGEDDQHPRGDRPTPALLGLRRRLHLVPERLVLLFQDLDFVVQLVGVLVVRRGFDRHGPTVPACPAVPRDARAPGRGDGRPPCTRHGERPSAVTTGASGEDLRLLGVELGVGDRALLLEVGELGQLVGAATRRQRSP